MHKLKNNFETTLAAAITTTGQLTMQLTADPSLAYPYWLTIGNDAKTGEIVEVTGKTGSDFNIVRVQQGTTAQTFAMGTKVRMFDTAGHWNEVQSVRSLVGNKIVFLGDSITGNNTSSDILYANWAWVLSKGRIIPTFMAGVAGEGTTQMLARFDTDVKAKNPTLCAILAGTNDINNSIALSTTKTNLELMITSCINAGIIPIIGTIPPVALVGNRTNALKLNIIIRSLATKYNIHLVDFFNVLVDPSNGGYKTGLTSDNTHPNASGAKIMGKLFSDQIFPMLMNKPSSLPGYNDGYNSIINGVFIGDTNADGVADNWTKSGTGQGTISLITTDNNILGNWQQIDKTASESNNLSVYSNIVTSGFNVGDKVLICFRIQTEGMAIGGATFSVKLSTGTLVLSSWSQDIEDGVIVWETTIPGNLYLTATINIGIGKLKIAQTGIYNLTTLGL